MRSDRCSVQPKNFASVSFVGLLSRWRETSDEFPLPLGEGWGEGRSCAVYSDCAFEVLQSGNLAVAAAVMSICSELFRVCTRSSRTIRRDHRNRHGDLATASLSAFLRGWIRSGEVGLETFPSPSGRGTRGEGLTASGPHPNPLPVGEGVRRRAAALQE